MEFVFEIRATADYQQGKFASRDDLSEQIQSELESADPGSLTSENDGEYEISNWEVEEIPQVKPRAYSDARALDEIAHLVATAGKGPLSQVQLNRIRGMLKRAKRQV